MAASRRGFYWYLDRFYAVCLGWAMRHRWLVCAVSLLAIAANVPLYRLVQQDYVPTNVDESEFEVRVETKEGSSLTSTDEAMRVAEEFLLEEPGVATVLTTVGGRGAVNRGEMVVRLADIETRTFSLGRLVRGLINGDPGEALEQTADGRWRVNVSVAGTRAALVERSPIEPVRVPSRRLTSGLSRMKPEELAPSIPVDRDDLTGEAKVPHRARDRRTDQTEAYDRQAPEVRRIHGWPEPFRHEAALPPGTPEAPKRRGGSPPRCRR